MGDDKDIIANEMKDLRTKSSTIESETKFKKVAFGGISEKEVMEYINSVTQQFNRAEEAYRQRIDEFATHTEMLVKECEDALEQIQAKSDVIQELQSEQASLKNEIAELQKKAEEDRQHAIGSKADEADIYEKGKNDRELLQENELLKKELSCVQEERDEFGGEAAVLAATLQETKELLESISQEKNTLHDEFVAYRSLVRQTDMKKSFSLRQYSEKQIHHVNQTSKRMKEMLAVMDGMRNDLYTLLTSIDENKMAEKTKAPSGTEEAVS